MVAKKRSHSEIGRANNESGKRAEREVVAYLRAHGWPAAERTVRTGYAVAGRDLADRGDIDGTPGLVWQVKAVQERSHYLTPQWLAKAEAQRRAAGADVAVLVLRRYGHPSAGKWWAHVTLAALRLLLDAPADDRATNGVRLELSDLVALLRTAGYTSGEQQGAA